MDLELRGKTAVITGGSVGIGLAVAEALAREGVNLVLCAREEARLSARASEIEGRCGIKVVGVRADVTKPEDVTRLTSETEKAFGGADILINNAGTGSNEKIMDAPDEKWQYFWDLFVMAPVRLARAFVPSMRQRGGGAILVSTSSSVKEPIPNLGLSTVLRASVSALAKTLALELAADKIRVNQIIPGRIDTDRVRQLDEIAAKKQGITLEQAKAKSIAAIPFGRYGEPAEFGRVGAFLLSPAASYMTGATVQVDGGAIHSVL